jgi:hypothetical protein
MSETDARQIIPIAKGETSNRPPEIVVTSEMVDEGVTELTRHHYGDDVRYMLECVFRAMAYVSPSASVTIRPK